MQARPMQAPLGRRGPEPLEGNVLAVQPKSRVLPDGRKVGECLQSTMSKSARKREGWSRGCDG